MNAPRRAGHPGGAGEGGAQTLKAVLVIVVVILIGVAVLHRSGKPVSASSSSTAPPTTHGATQPNKPATATTTTVPAPTTTTTLVPVSSVKLTVLNGTGISGVAKQWSDKLKANPGYNTLPPDNATDNVTASVIYVITPGYQARPTPWPGRLASRRRRSIPRFPPRPARLSRPPSGRRRTWS